MSFLNLPLYLCFIERLLLTLNIPFVLPHDDCQKWSRRNNYLEGIYLSIYAITCTKSINIFSFNPNIRISLVLRHWRVCLLLLCSYVTFFTYWLWLNTVQKIWRAQKLSQDCKWSQWICKAKAEDGWVQPDAKLCNHWKLLVSFGNHIGLNKVLHDAL
jgi:hypothetical protein